MNERDEERENIQEKLLNFREHRSKIIPIESQIISTRRLIGYSKLLKTVSDQIVNDNNFHLGMDKTCIKDSISHQAFFHMLDWHLRVRDAQ